MFSSKRAQLNRQRAPEVDNSRWQINIYVALLFYATKLKHRIKKENHLVITNLQAKSFNLKNNRENRCSAAVKTGGLST